MLTLTGINIQYPWSDLLITGKKTIETRNYKIPDKYIGKKLALIETPGPRGKNEGILNARIIGFIIFSECFLYKNRKHWEKDMSKHLVSPDDKNYKYNKGKWGWVVQEVKKAKKQTNPPKPRGIIFASNCQVDI